MKSKSFFHQLFFVVIILFSTSIFAQNSLAECRMILELNGKQYCIDNASYSSTYNGDMGEEAISEMPDLKAGSYNSLSIIMSKDNLTQELLDWAFVSPSKKYNGTIKIYNTLKTKIIKEISFEDANLSSFSDADYTKEQTPDYNATNFYMTCKKMSVKLKK